MKLPVAATPFFVGDKAVADFRTENKSVGYIFPVGSSKNKCFKVLLHIDCDSDIQVRLSVFGDSIVAAAGPVVWIEVDVFDSPDIGTAVN